MSFKDRDWSSRFADMGDQAEGRFETYAKDVLDLGFVRYGLDRPPIQMHVLPKRICYTPDYLMSRKLVEVQGVGRDQLIKLKHDKLGALHWWNDIKTESFEGVWLYIWDSHKKRECFFPLGVIDTLINDGRITLGTFPEGKSYWAFAADDVFDAAA